MIEGREERGPSAPERPARESAKEPSVEGASADMGCTSPPPPAPSGREAASEEAAADPSVLLAGEGESGGGDDAGGASGGERIASGVELRRASLAGVSAGGGTAGGGSGGDPVATNAGDPDADVEEEAEEEEDAEAAAVVGLRAASAAPCDGARMTSWIVRCVCCCFSRCKRSRLARCWLMTCVQGVSGASDVDRSRLKRWRTRKRCALMSEQTSATATAWKVCGERVWKRIVKVCECRGRRERGSQSERGDTKS